MNWIEEKKRLFEQLYVPAFSGRGFKKRGWEFYKVLDTDKMGFVVKITSSGSNLINSVSFRIEIGIIFNPAFPDKLKNGDINLYNCQISFPIVHLLYPEEPNFLSEYWYNLGDDFEIGLGKEIGAKKESIHKIHGARTGTDKYIHERITPTHIKHTSQSFTEQGELISEEEFVYHDLSDRYNSQNLASIQKTLTSDLDVVFRFADKLSNIEEFLSHETNHVIPDKIRLQLERQQL